MAAVVLCVAEKPSLAASLAALLSDGTHVTRRGGQDVHEFDRAFQGQHCHFKAGPADVARHRVPDGLQWYSCDVFS